MCVFAHTQVMQFLARFDDDGICLSASYPYTEKNKKCDMDCIPRVRVTGLVKAEPANEVYMHAYVASIYIYAYIYTCMQTYVHVFIYLCTHTPARHYILTYLPTYLLTQVGLANALMQRPVAVGIYLSRSAQHYESGMGGET